MLKSISPPRVTSGLLENPGNLEPLVLMGRPGHRAITACPDKRVILERMVKTESEARPDAMDHQAKRELLGIPEMLVNRGLRVEKDHLASTAHRVRWDHQVPKAKWV